MTRPTRHPIFSVSLQEYHSSPVLFAFLMTWHTLSSLVLLSGNLYAGAVKMLQTRLYRTSAGGRFLERSWMSRPGILYFKGCSTSATFGQPLLGPLP